MSHQNRNRVVVDLNGKWRLYTNTIPANSTPLGTVTRDESDTGALVRNDTTGVYVQVNAGVVRGLDQRKIKAALGISNNAGAPTQLNDARPCNLSLDAETRSIFERLGNGKMSAGARIAAQIAKNNNK